MGVGLVFRVGREVGAVNQGPRPPASRPSVCCSVSGPAGRVLDGEGGTPSQHSWSLQTSCGRRGLGSAREKHRALWGPPLDGELE